MYGNKELPKEIDFFDQTTKDHFISEKKIVQVSRPMSGFGDVKSIQIVRIIDFPDSFLSQNHGFPGTRSDFQNLASTSIWGSHDLWNDVICVFKCLTMS